MQLIHGAFTLITSVWEAETANINMSCNAVIAVYGLLSAFVLETRNKCHYVTLRSIIRRHTLINIIMYHYAPFSVILCHYIPLYSLASRDLS